MGGEQSFTAGRWAASPEWSSCSQLPWRLFEHLHQQEGVERSMLLVEGGDKHDVAFSKIPRRMLCPQTTVGASPFEFRLLKWSWLWEAASFHPKKFLERAEGSEPHPNLRSPGSLVGSLTHYQSTNMGKGGCGGQASLIPISLWVLPSTDGQCLFPCQNGGSVSCCVPWCQLHMLWQHLHLQQSFSCILWWEYSTSEPGL